MPTNTQVVSALQFSGTVPPDQECNIGSLTAILQGAVNFLQVVTQQAQINDGGGTGNSIAQQALQIANIALSTAEAAKASIPARRTSQSPVSMPVGDSVLPITWTPSMPDTNYEVRLTYYGPNSAVANFYAFRVIDGSRTVDGCQLRLDNTPVSTKVSYVVEALTLPA